MKKARIAGRDLKSLPFEIKAEMALKEAVAEAIAEHKRRGHPIAVWRDGKVVLIPPDEITVPEVIPRKNTR
jgi:hypothetical protein